MSSRQARYSGMWSSQTEHNSLSAINEGHPVQEYANHDYPGLDSNFSTLLLVGYLNQDQRPTFVVDVGDNRSPDDAALEFSNKALIELSSLYEDVINIFGQSRNQQTLDEDSKAFESWIATVAKRAIRSESTQPQIFYDLLWTATVINGQWAVVSGVEVTTVRSSSETTMSSHAAFSNSDVSRIHKRPRVELGGFFSPYELAEPDHLKFIRSFDWASTPLGRIEGWSPQLRQSCELMLANPDPATIFWGDDLVMIYNEAYIAVAGNKHPSLMGGSARIHFKEVWDQYDPLFDQMRRDGRPFKQENVQLYLYRRGYLEEGFFNLSVMPLLGEDGSVAGFYEPVYEITRQTLSERRILTLLRLSESMASATSLKELWRLALSALKEHGSDVHFTVLHSLEQKQQSNTESDEYIFEGAVGFHDGTLNFQSLSTVAEREHNNQSFEPAFRAAHRTGSAVLLQASDKSLSKDIVRTLQEYGMEDGCRELVVCPLSSSVKEGNMAFLTIGVSPKRLFDDDYRRFTQLLTRQIETAITSVNLFEKEKARLKELAVHESELKLKQLAERVPVGIFMFDVGGSIKFCNDAWLELSGHQRDDMSAMSWVHDVHPDCAAETRAYWDKLSRLEGPQTFEVQYKRPWKGGTDTICLDRTYVVASAYSEVDENGILIGITGCVTDISHQKWADQLQSQRLSEALELKRQQENFMDITSHEMRNPLNAILHCAAEIIELLTDQTVHVMPVDQRLSILGECLDASRTIAYCGRHQKRIIDDVLTLSKLDSDLLTIAPLATRPHDIVEEVLKVFDTELRTSAVQTSTELEESYLNHHIDFVLIDPHRVIQILINLVANAIKFMKDGSHRNLRIAINASLTEPTGHTTGVRYAPSGRHRETPDPTRGTDWGNEEAIFLHFSVQDTGPGMSQEEANSLFNRFVQGTPRTHAQYGGSGLGLFISRELAELHGGRVGISSQLGLGSTFDFYVKCRRAAEGVARTASMPDEETNTTIGMSMTQKALQSHRSSDAGQPAVKRASKSSPSVLQTPSTDRLHVVIVEDNKINQKILSKLMRKQGFDVSIANHGEEALALIQTSTWATGRNDSGVKLDVILADIEMPVMDGKACVRKIREWQQEGLLHAYIPVIAVTGNARSEQIIAAKKCGFDDVVSKPYQVDDLVRLIYHFTRHSRDEIA